MGAARLFTSPASSVAMGWPVAVIHVVPSTKNLYSTGWSHGTSTEAVHWLPTCVMGVPMVHAPAA